METAAWSTGLISVLESIRKNSVHLSNYHKKRYLKYKGYAKYFKIPLIILSGLNSVISVGLQSYMAQNIISAMTCVISLLCAVITSIELYLGIQKTMENELLASKDFYLLAVDIFKISSLPAEDRMVNARTYLDDKYKHYCKLMENSDLLDTLNIPHIRDQLTIVNIRPSSHDSSSTSSSQPSTNSIFSLALYPSPPTTPHASTSAVV
jgi:hypothetical protein